MFLENNCRYLKVWVLQDRVQFFCVTVDGCQDNQIFGNFTEIFDIVAANGNGWIRVFKSVMCLITTKTVAMVIPKQM